MAASIDTAYLETTALFRTAWAADEASVDVPIVYENDGTQPPDANDSGNNFSPSEWARLSMLLQDGFPAAFGVDGKMKERTLGVVIIEIRTPAGQGLQRSHILANIARNALRGKRTSSGVLFRNVRAQSIGQDGNWYQMNVLADIEFDELV